MEILASRRRNLKKCRLCHFKRRKCIIDPDTCKAKKVPCNLCQNVGHFPKSLNCHKGRKLGRIRIKKNTLLNIEGNRNKKHPKYEKYKIDENQKNFIKQRIFEIEQDIKRSLIRQRISDALKQGDKSQEQAKQGVIFYPNLFP